jgi:hypothetical protein
MSSHNKKALPGLAGLLGDDFSILLELKRKLKKRHCQNEIGQSIDYIIIILSL